MTVELESKSNLSISLYLKIIVDKLRIFAMVKIEFNYLPIRGINGKIDHDFFFVKKSEKGNLRRRLSRDVR